MSPPLRQDPIGANRLERMANEWREHLSAAPSASLQLLANLPAEVISELANAFYRTLQADPHAYRFLAHEDVWNGLRPALVRWLQAVFTATPAQALALAELNHRAGTLHARIDLPVELTARGFRILRHRLADVLQQVTPDTGLAFTTLRVAGESMDIAMEGMSAACVSGNERSARSDASYRLFSLMRNVSTERERQRALLLDWENSLLYALACGGKVSSTPTLTDTEFGRWFVHKAAPNFGDPVGVEAVQQAITDVDVLLSQEINATTDQMQTLELIRHRLATIRTTLNILFEQVSELDSGTDTLTALLNRRFLPSVLRREILLADRSGNHFTLLLLDIDHFKSINDRFGHSAGDAILRHVAELLAQQTRGSDYLFRLGGEEFLAVLIDCAEARAVTVAERICQQLSQSPMDWIGCHEGITVTTSIGVAVYDGHPDYEHLLKRADAAMYEAKRAGRNQVQISRVQANAT